MFRTDHGRCGDWDRGRWRPRVACPFRSDPPPDPRPPAREAADHRRNRLPVRNLADRDHAPPSGPGRRRTGHESQARPSTLALPQLGAAAADVRALDRHIRRQLGVGPSSVRPAGGSAFKTREREPPGGGRGPRCVYRRASARRLRSPHRGSGRLVGTPLSSLGGLLVETWENGGAVLATVTGWTDDRYLQMAGPFHLGVALGIATFELSDGGD